MLGSGSVLEKGSVISLVSYSSSDNSLSSSDSSGSRRVAATSFMLMPLLLFDDDPLALDALFGVCLGFRCVVLAAAGFALPAAGFALPADR